MHVPRIIKFVLLVVLFVGFVLLLPLLAHPQHFAFRHKSAGYYGQFAKACDSLLTQHPVGTNKVLELPVTDASVPNIIRDVHPVRIKLGTNWVWILAWGESHGNGVGITWAPENEAQTNVWILRTTVESHTRAVYVASR